MAQNFFNAAYAPATVYAPDGEVVHTTRLNAIDLVRSNGYSWNQGTPGAKAPEIVAAPAEATPPAPENVASPATPETEAPGTVDHLNDPLSEIALAITGSADVEKYLEGFTDDALRTMAEERYGQKVHHKTSHENIVAKIVGWEAEKLAVEAD